MELQKHVCSFKLSKKLEELGIKQQSIFYWVSDAFRAIPFFEEDFKPKYKLASIPFISSNEYPAYSAFMASELGILLKWPFTWFIPDEMQSQFKDLTEADVRATVLIYLIEKKAIKLELENER